MSYQLSDELKALQATVRNFVKKEIIPREVELDFDAPLLKPEQLKEVQEKARSAGLWLLNLPEEYGGGGLSLFAQCIVAEEASQHRLGAYNPCGGAFGFDVPHILCKGNKDQINRFLVPTIENGFGWFVAITEPSGGADPARAIQTRAYREGNNWIINGTKIFISYADQAKYGVVFARTNPDKGRKGISCFIVEKDTTGLSWSFVPVIRPWYPTEISFQDVVVPDSQLLGEEGKGFDLANDWLVKQRIPYAAACIGIATAALRIAIDHSKQRSTFGSLLSQRQAVQWMIADSEVELRAARWLTWEAAWKYDRGENARYEASIAKLYATETAGRVVDRCIQILGGMGVSKELPLERWYRELRIKRIGEGPSEVHRMLISREILS